VRTALEAHVFSLLVQQSIDAGKASAKQAPPRVFTQLLELPELIQHSEVGPDRRSQARAAHQAEQSPQRRQGGLHALVTRGRTGREA